MPLARALLEVTHSAAFDATVERRASQDLLAQPDRAQLLKSAFATDASLRSSGHTNSRGHSHAEPGQAYADEDEAEFGCSPTACPVGTRSLTDVGDGWTRSASRYGLDCR